MTIYDLLDKHQNSLTRDQIRDIMEYEHQRCLSTPGCTLVDLTKAKLKLQEFEDQWEKDDNMRLTEPLADTKLLDLSPKKKHAKKHN